MSAVKPLGLVTGASAGIGATFARRLFRDGYRLILVARRQDRLDALARELGGAETLAADLIDEAGLKLVEDRILAAPDLELLVNNAGFGFTGRFFDLPVDGHDAMHRLHIMATMRLTHAALGGMVARGKAAVVNVSSVAGFGTSPGSVSYSATKAWINNFTEGVAMDLRSAGSPVKVQALCPGFTITEFHDVMKMDRSRIPGRMWMRAEDVVDASLKGLERGKLFVVPGAFYKFLTWLQVWTPRPLRFALAMRYARATKRDRT